MSAILQAPVAAAQQVPSRRRTRDTLFRAVTWSVTTVAVMLILYPLARTVGTIAGFGSEPSQLGVMWSALWQRRTLGMTINTIVAVGVGGGLALMVGAVFAWVNERTDARMGFAAKSLPMIPMFIPSIAGAIGWVFLASDNAGILNVLARDALGVFGIELTQGPFDIYSWPGLIFAYFLFLTPYAYLTISSGLQALDPALEEASRSAGAGAVATFIRVSLPSLRPSLGASVLLIVTMGFALFSIPLVIGVPAGIDILPVAIVHMIIQQYPSDVVGALGLSLIVIAVVASCWLMQRRMVRTGNHATISGRAGRDARFELGRWRIVIRAAMIGFLLLTSVLPFAGLLYVSLRSYWSADVSIVGMTLRNYESLVHSPLVWSGLKNSVVLAVIGATVAIVAAALIVVAVESGRTWIGSVVDGIVKIPASLTHIIVALAFLVAFAGVPFNLVGTYTILLLAYMVLYLPQATFYGTASYHQIGRHLTEASITSGASSGKTFRRIVLPLMLPGLIAGWSLLFVLITGDITASSMLAGTHTPVVGFVILDLWTSGTFPQLAALGVLMTAVACAVVLSALWIRDRYRVVD